MPAIGQSNTSEPLVLDDEMRVVALRAQLAQNAQTVRMSLIGGVVNFVLLSAVLRLYDAIDWPVLGAAAVTLGGLLWWRYRISFSGASDIGDDVEALSAARRAITINAGCQGAFWGLTCVYAFASGDPEVHVFASAFGAGMTCAGAFTYRTVAPAARAWMLSLSPAAVVSLLLPQHVAGFIAVNALLCYLAILMLHVRANEMRFTKSLLRERALERQSETISLLLNDFTEQGADWLIEVDGLGRLVKPCDRMAQAAGRPVELLEGMLFSRLLDHGDQREVLKARFFSGEPIRQLVVSLTIGGERRWWSVSARPTRDGRVRYRGVITDITAQRQAEAKVSYLAHYDGLTELPNRFLFTERLHNDMIRSNGDVGLMYLDLDHFKSINDTLGHPVGDMLLQHVARRMVDTVGRSGLVARLGGDEFAVLVSARRVPGIQRLAQRIVAALAKPIALGDHDVIVGASIGIAIAPVDATTPDGLLRRADLALYAAKARGRGQVARFHADMDAVAQERRTIENDLRSAVSRGEMRLHYQPLIDAATSGVVGYEALIRWEHPERGVVMPNNFISIAEDTGLIIPIGEWVIRQALDDAARWPEHVSIAINLSPLQMRSPTLISNVVSALANSGVAPARLCLEITESVLMQDTDVNIETLHRLRGLGIQIALDDFGTGYSSLNYLRSFPFSKIKIDRCFVSEIDEREDCQAIVRSVVGLANSLGMTTIAEGVERQVQADILLREGCREVQGFLYSAALPIDELTDLRPAHTRLPFAAATLDHHIADAGHGRAHDGHDAGAGRDAA